MTDALAEYIDWYNTRTAIGVRPKKDTTRMTQLPFLNLGCGKIALPGEQPGHHSIVESAIYQYPLWHNVDRNAQPGVDECVDVFTYPWPWADNSFDGALLSHIVEHITHETRASDEPMVYEMHVTEQEMRDYFLWVARNQHLRNQFQDGWHAFFYELWRVLTPGTIAHILGPYCWTQGAMCDPTHTRYLTEQTFVHGDDSSPFVYKTGGAKFELVKPAQFKLNELFMSERDDYEVLQRHFATRVNVVYDIYVQLRAVK